MTDVASPERLAIDGGPKVRATALPHWPHYDQEQINAVERVLRSGLVNYWTGEEGRHFEREFATYHGVAHAVALANGTLALDLALRILGIGPGDDVVVTPRSFFASAGSVALAGADPVFADVDPESQLITRASIEAALTPRTKAILVVHLAGWPCDMPSIMDLAREHGLRVIEDCAQANGARIDGKFAGTFGDVAAFSFCQDKIMSTGGEGGMILTDDPALWEAAWSFKDHGKSHAKTVTRDPAPGFKWVHEGLGSNYRMTETQAAIGRIQLRKLDGWVAVRRDHAARLTSGLGDLAALRLTRPPANVHHAYYKYYAFVRPDRLKSGWSRDRILQSFIAEGIPGLSGSCPEIYREVAFLDRTVEPLPMARELGETSFMLPVHPTLRDRDIDDLIHGVRKVIMSATK